jgi:hypothetical protein
MNNYLLKSRQHCTHHFLKPASGNLTGFEKLSANSEESGAKRLRTYKFGIKLKALLKKSWISVGLFPNQGPSNHTT